MATIPVPGTVVQVGSQVSPSGDTGIGGPAGPAPNQGIVIGGTVAEPNFPGGVIVPSFAAHPDAIWTPLGAFDDHFDAASLDPKWTVAAPTAGMIGIVTPTIVGSTLNFSGGAPAGDVATLYTQSVLQALPNTNRFELSMCVEAICLANSVSGTNNSVAQVILRLENTAGNSGVQIRFSSYCLAATGTTQALVAIDVGAWAVNFNGFCTTDIRYIKFRFDPTDNSTLIYYSKNGKVWFPYGTSITGATSGFTSTPPNKFRFYLTAQRNAFAMFSCDWVKFVNV